MSMRSLGRMAALVSVTAVGLAACAPHQATNPAVPLEPVTPAPGSTTMTTTTTTTTVPLGTPLVPSLDAPAVPRPVTTAPFGAPVAGQPVTTAPFGAPVAGQPITTAPFGSVVTQPVTTAPFNQQVVMPNTVPTVGVAPVYTPPTAQPRGAAPSDPSQYVTNSTVSVAGRVVSISVATGSFLLQTASEGWTVVLPVGASAPSVAVGRNVTVTGYAHRTERNQLLATSISP